MFRLKNNTDTFLTFMINGKNMTIPARGFSSPLKCDISDDAKRLIEKNNLIVIAEKERPVKTDKNFKIENKEEKKK